LEQPKHQRTITSPSPNQCRHRTRWAEDLGLTGHALRRYGVRDRVRAEAFD
jgi:hypothetical protein